MQLETPGITKQFLSGGAGIGLSIVKKIVENHQGIISVESKLGEGTVFHIYIPFLQH
ncbi:MAG: Two-component system, sensory histidine kinase [Chitinophagaceae bacterium]|nr:Two-component system, sensory histidine kinase [Chitinophagaceae bacterium]